MIAPVSITPPASGDQLVAVRPGQLRMELAGEHATLLQRGDEAPAVLSVAMAQPGASSTR